MMWVYDFFIQPFVDYGFMSRALFGSWFLALAAAPMGLFLILRRMSLVADSMSHAILPGVAVGFLVSGTSIMAMALGGVVAGLTVALLAGVVTRKTKMKEDNSFASFYLISLSLGVLLISLKGSNVDLLHVLFGTVLGLDDDSMLFMMLVSSVTVIVLALIYRPLLIECFDRAFMYSESRFGAVVHAVYLVLLVVNLVAGFQVLGTLMVVGMMLLPASAAGFLARTVGKQIMVAVLIGLLSAYVGLLISFQWSIPASSAIMLVAGLIYILSVLFGRQGSILYDK